jgi:uncharacterized protein (TIGR02271 family)
MSADQLQLRFVRILSAIVSALQSFPKKIASLYETYPEEGSEQEIRTVPGSVVVSDRDRQHVIDLFGESIHVDKERIQQGEVVVRKEVITETQMISVPVTREELVIERKGTNGTTLEVLRGQPIVRVPLSEERVLVRKETVLNERVTVLHRTTEEQKKVSTVVRHEELKVAKNGNVQVDERAA